MTSFSVDGSEDPWLLLERVSRENRPLVIRTRDNPELLAHAAQTGLIVVRGHIRDDALAEKGMPSNAINEELYAWEDELITALASLRVEAFAVAVVTGDGRRDLVFATKDMVGLARCVTDVPSPALLQIEIESVEDALPWWPLLRATELDKQIDGDRAVLQSLEEHGDAGTQRRKIDFWFYGNKPDLELLLVVLDQEGFAFEAWLEEPTGLIVSRHSPATADHFNALTPRLLELATAHDVTYDGWESVVVAEPHPTEIGRTSFFSRIFGPKND